MWEPDPAWYPVSGGTGTSTVGVWRTERSGQALVVKRLGVPAPDDPAEYLDPRHFAYWRREADVAITGVVDEAPGLRGTVVDVAEDDEGITLTREFVEDAALNGLYVAHAMGRFAGAELGRHSWLAVDQLRDRMSRVERRAGPDDGRRRRRPAVVAPRAAAARARRPAPGAAARRSRAVQPPGSRR
jgi:hypothetical protein